MHTQAMNKVKIALVMACLSQACCSTRSDQEYIVVRPRIVLLNDEGRTKPVRITCRQLPVTSSNRPVSLTISRKPRYGSEKIEKLAIMDSNGLVTAFGAASKYNALGNDVSKELTLSIPRATCEVAKYSYLCESRLTNENNTSVAKVFAAVLPPAVKLTAKPAREVYSKHDKVTLTCGSNDSTGLTTDNMARGRWFWEYNDFGPWLAVPENKVTVKAGMTESGCFQKTTSPTQLTVRLADLTTCFRRYRCYVLTEFLNDPDQTAQEWKVDQGPVCRNTMNVSATNPIVAIVGVLVVIVILFGIVYYSFRYSRYARRRENQQREREIDMRILSPMTPEQRDKFFSEKLKNKEVNEYQPLKSALKESQPVRPVIELPTSNRHSLSSPVEPPTPGETSSLKAEDGSQRNTQGESDVETENENTATKPGLEKPKAESQKESSKTDADKKGATHAGAKEPTLLKRTVFVYHDQQPKGSPESEREAASDISTTTSVESEVQ